MGCVKILRSEMAMLTAIVELAVMIMFVYAGKIGIKSYSKSCCNAAIFNSLAKSALSDVEKKWL